MDKMSGYAFVAGSLSTILALLAYLGYALSGLRAARMQTAGATVRSGSPGFITRPSAPSVSI